MTAAERLLRCRSVGAALASQSDAALIELLASGESGSGGIGGTHVCVDVGGVRVFAKCVPVSDLELAQDNRGSTANLFGLPGMYHYGVGSTGTNVWRELAAHELVTSWVTAGRAAGFPVLYHARLLPIRTSSTPNEGLEDTASIVSYWDGCEAVGRRVEALAASTSSLALFLECIPLTLPMWLSERSDDDDLAAAYDLVERRLLAAVEFMNAEGLYHFDIHPNNVLTDGKELYLTDFGLASSDQFELTEPEREFLATNATHDQCLARAMLVNCLVAQLFRPTDAARRNQMIRELASRAPLAGVPAALSGIMSRHAPVAVVINDFYWRLFGETRAARYPVEAAERVLRDSGFVGARD